jgi:hypothetical protein
MKSRNVMAANEMRRPDARWWAVDCAEQLAVYFKRS